MLGSCSIKGEQNTVSKSQVQDSWSESRIFDSTRKHEQVFLKFFPVWNLVISQSPHHITFSPSSWNSQKIIKEFYSLIHFVSLTKNVIPCAPLRPTQLCKVLTHNTKTVCKTFWDYFCNHTHWWNSITSPSVLHLRRWPHSLEQAGFPGSPNTFLSFLNYNNPLWFCAKAQTPRKNISLCAYCLDWLICLEFNKNKNTTSLPNYLHLVV